MWSKVFEALTLSREFMHRHRKASSWNSHWEFQIPHHSGIKVRAVRTENIHLSCPPSHSGSLFCEALKSSTQIFRPSLLNVFLIIVRRSPTSFESIRKRQGKIWVKRLQSQKLYRLRQWNPVQNWFIPGRTVSLCLAQKSWKWSV